MCLGTCFIKLDFVKVVDFVKLFKVTLNWELPC